MCHRSIYNNGKIHQIQLDYYPKCFTIIKSNYDGNTNTIYIVIASTEVPCNIYIYEYNTKTNIHNKIQTLKHEHLRRIKSLKFIDGVDYSIRKNNSLYLMSLSTDKLLLWNVNLYTNYQSIIHSFSYHKGNIYQFKVFDLKNLFDSKYVNFKFNSFISK